MSNLQWPCPENLKIGDRIEVRSSLTSFQEKMTAYDIRHGAQDTYVSCKTDGGHLFVLPMSDTEYLWRVLGSDRVTLPASTAAAPAFGATCRKCNVHNEYAETRPDFVCGSCRSFS